ncbi:MAG: hypothetical protein ACT4O4_04095 [Nitrospiraceae bacterium]
MRFSSKRGRRIGAAQIAVAGCVFMSAAFPALVSATHEADHRFTVEGYVCGPDGKGVANTEVLVKDTKISYGQVVKTDGAGYYKATFHLHNDNLSDPLLVEAKGEQQNHRIKFDPEDRESERKTRINFGSGCDTDSPPTWLWWGIGALAAAVGGVAGLKVVRSQRKRERTGGKSQGKRKQ